jgi:glycosyltransferase involved in cell wall biosynthesis
MSALNIEQPENGSERPSILILFPDDWAAYSPTLTRLTSQLKEFFAVRVHALDTGRADNSSLDLCVYRRVHLHPLFARILRKTGLYRLVRTLMLAHSARDDAKHSTHVIAVDADGAVVARILRKQFHLLSLEIGWHPVMRRIVSKHALSIVIQSRTRLEFQFETRKIAAIPTFIVQNSPSLSMDQKEHVLSRSVDVERPRFVYLGHAIPLHGLRPMLDLISAWPGATLTLQGIQPERSLRLIKEYYGHLLDSGAISFSTSYLSEAELGLFLAKFDIGLCLYELDRKHTHDFNYLSSPAGKMFNYFSSALPVIASNQIGLNPVSDYNAGIQVPNNSAAELRSAASMILANHEHYRKGCIEAAIHYDFRISVNHFVNFLRSGKASP